MTDVINGQALCPACNLQKGAFVSNLRPWQERALRELNVWTPVAPQHGFLVEATPGAGKTRLAVEFAQRKIRSGEVSCVVVAVPTTSLEKQWASAFHAAGLNLNPAWRAGDGCQPEDEIGFAATYAEIAAARGSYRTVCHRSRTLVILDEVHHCGGDERVWGAAARVAFEHAAFRLLLSGTPFRSDGNEIPFVNYVDGAGTPDFRYGYADALADGVVRSIFFPSYGGVTEWSYGSAQIRKHSFDDDLNEVDSKRRLRTALNPTGDWLPPVIRDADSKLLQLRESDPLAGGIIFCEDTEGAHAIADTLQRVTGRRPVLAISSEPDSDDRIDDFRKSSDMWLIAIRKVSEGVDIPRLRVGVYATPWDTELFFRQVVGRLVRVRDGDEEVDPTAFLFIPDDPKLRAMAHEIQQAREAILDRRNRELLDKVKIRDGGEPSLFQPISATAETRGVIAGDGLLLTPEQLALAIQAKAATPGTAGLGDEVAAMLLLNAGLLGGVKLPGGDNVKPSILRADERKKRLRQANNETISRIHFQHGSEYSHINRALNDLLGVKRVVQCTEEQLEKRLSHAQAWLETGYPPASLW